MKRIILAVLGLFAFYGHAAEVGVLEKAVLDGMGMIGAGKIHDAMNEIRVGINCYGYDQRQVAPAVVANLDSKIDQEKDNKKKSALLVYRAVILLSTLQSSPESADKAIETLNAAEKADPNLPEVYNTRGICHFFKKNADLALIDYEKAIALNPNYLDAINNRGDAYWVLGKKEKALEDKIKYQRLLSKLNNPEKK